MNDVGTHSKPVNGVVTNGHAPTLASFTVPQLEIRQSGPMTPWPHPAAPDRWRHVTSAVSAMAAHRGWLAAIPVILVNAVAFGAQLGFWRIHLPLPFEAVLVALALESIAIYLAWLAHLAQLADDSALRLRLAAYGMALLIGVLNYSHFMRPGWRPTVAAVTFGMMSAISPWLWSVYSRRASRDALKARGLIEPHAVRLGATRWTWHPWRCIRVMSRATWVAENDPAKAIALPAIKTVKVAAEGVAASVSDDGDGASVSPSPVTPETPLQDHHEAAGETVSESAAPPSPRPSRQPSNRTSARQSGRDKAVAIIKKDGTLTDKEVAKRARVSESTARRARASLA